jgi:hypothetical protein
VGLDGLNKPRQADRLSGHRPSSNGGGVSRPCCFDSRGASYFTPNGERNCA